MAAAQRIWIAFRKVTVVLGQVQRIKQYVFETSGLNEIRASELLERLVTKLAGEVKSEMA